jgi:hypothetical protein
VVGGTCPGSLGPSGVAAAAKQPTMTAPMEATTSRAGRSPISRLVFLRPLLVIAPGSGDHGCPVHKGPSSPQMRGCGPWRLLVGRIRARVACTRRDKTLMVSISRALRRARVNPPTSLTNRIGPIKSSLKSRRLRAQSLRLLSSCCW